MPLALVSTIKGNPAMNDLASIPKTYFYCYSACFNANVVHFNPLALISFPFRFMEKLKERGLLLSIQPIHTRVHHGNVA